MAQLRIAKLAQYGEDRYQIQMKDWWWDLVMCWSDIYRKYCRMKTLIRTAKEQGPSKALRDCFMDLANYGIMGVQIIDIIDEMKMEECDVGRLED